MGEDEEWCPNVLGYAIGYHDQKPIMEAMLGNLPKLTAKAKEQQAKAKAHVAAGGDRKDVDTTLDDLLSLRFDSDMSPTSSIGSDTETVLQILQGVTPHTGPHHLHIHCHQYRNHDPWQKSTNETSFKAGAIPGCGGSSNQGSGMKTCTRNRKIKIAETLGISRT